jgi:hypothetical protein
LFADGIVNKVPAQNFKGIFYPQIPGKSYFNFRLFNGISFSFEKFRNNLLILNFKENFHHVTVRFLNLKSFKNLATRKNKNKRRNLKGFFHQRLNFNLYKNQNKKSKQHIKKTHLTNYFSIVLERI